MTADIPNAFVQTEVDPEDGIILMKIRGAMVDYLLEIDNLRYRDFVTVEDNKKILYVKMVKALCGMLKSSLLYYKQEIQEGYRGDRFQSESLRSVCGESYR